MFSGNYPLIQGQFSEVGAGYFKSTVGSGFGVGTISKNVVRYFTCTWYLHFLQPVLLQVRFLPLF